MQRTRANPLKEQVYHAVKSRILNGEIQAGQSISENELSALMNVSRTPIREALQRLQVEGFVRILPNQGIFVPEISAREVTELFDVRRAIEPFIVRQIAGRLTAEDRERLWSLLSEGRKAAENRELLLAMKLDTDFHLELAACTHNSLFQSIMNNIGERLFYFGYKILVRKVERATDSFSEHEAILRALELPDADMAVDAMTAHLTIGERALLS